MLNIKLIFNYFLIVKITEWEKMFGNSAVTFLGSNCLVVVMHR